MHADHTVGLTSSWNTYKIYCSEVTRRLVIAKLGVNSDLVVGLPLDECVIINLDEAGKETMTVRLIDANHCPGSVMFIFEGYFGKILYTGDFRYCERFATHSAMEGKQFDVLYLDNTYCDAKCAFPTRTQATVNILEIIRGHPKCKVVIGLHNLGKEMLLHTIAVLFKTWIGVDPVRKETLKLLEMPNVFTCDVDKVRIRVVKSHEITKKNLQFWNSQEPTIAILPTCLYVGATNPYANVENLFVVPYSDHSSFEELRKFVQISKPRKIIPIVHKHRLLPGDTINSRVNMNAFQDLMDSSPSSEFTVPHSVACFMTREIQQNRKKRVKATGNNCLKKAAKVKKPCGVIFPPTPERAEMNGEDKSDLEMKESDGNISEQGITENGQNDGTLSSSKCSFADVESSEKSKVDKDSDEGITGDEINLSASLAGSKSGGNLVPNFTSGEEDRDMVQQSIGSKMKKVDSTSIVSSLVESESGAEKLNVDDVSGFGGSESREKQNVDDVSDDKHFQENSMVYEITVHKIDSVASSSKSGLTGSESGQTSKALSCEGDKDFQENSMVHEITGQKIDSVAFSSKSGLIGNVSGQTSKALNCKGNKDFQENSMVHEITRDEINSVPSLSKSGLTGCELGETSKALNFEGDKEPHRAQTTIASKEDAVASSNKTKNMCDKIINSQKGNISSRNAMTDKVTCVKVKDLCNNVIVPVENLSLKRKYSKLTDQNDKNSIDSVDKHSSSKKKFNIYTGCSCDFARKFLADMVKNAASGDK